MRTTVRIPDDLMLELKERAEAENLSVSKMLEQTLRRGLEAKPEKRKPFRQRTYAMGPPLINLDKANSIAAALEDEEIIRKLREGR